MRKRFSTIWIVALAATLAAVMIVGCTPEETAANDEPETSGSATNGGDATIDLTTVDLKAAVNAQIGEATAAGEYGCCLTMPCSQCMVNMGKCPCGKNVQDGNAVCHECKGGWDAGGGNIDGIDAADVKPMPRG